MKGAARLLIVEDESIVAMDLQSRLQGMGYQVVGCVASGERALECVAQDKPDLVLMDIRLRGKMSGIETARILRKRYAIPVVYLTALMDTSSLQEMDDTQPVGLVSKPFEESTLQKAIELGLERSRRRKQA